MEVSQVNTQKGLMLLEFLNEKYQTHNIQGVLNNLKNAARSGNVKEYDNFKEFIQTFLSRTFSCFLEENVVNNKNSGNPEVHYNEEIRYINSSKSVLSLNNNNHGQDFRHELSNSVIVLNPAKQSSISISNGQLNESSLFEINSLNNEIMNSNQQVKISNQNKSNINKFQTSLDNANNSKVKNDTTENIEVTSISANKNSNENSTLNSREVNKLKVNVYNGDVNNDIELIEDNQINELPCSSTMTPQDIINRYFPTTQNSPNIGQSNVSRNKSVHKKKLNDIETIIQDSSNYYRNENVLNIPPLQLNRTSKLVDCNSDAITSPTDNNENNLDGEINAVKEDELENNQSQQVSTDDQQLGCLTNINTVCDSSIYPTEHSNISQNNKRMYKLITRMLKSQNFNQSAYNECKEIKTLFNKLPNIIQLNPGQQIINNGHPINGKSCIFKDTSFKKSYSKNLLKLPRFYKNASVSFNNMISLPNLLDLYKCPNNDCGQTFNVKQLFITHVENHYTNTVLQNNRRNINVCNNECLRCVYCLKIFRSGIALANHIDENYSFCNYFCSLCLYRSYSASHVLIHQIHMHNEFVPSIVKFIKEEDSVVGNKTETLMAVDYNKFVSPIICNSGCEFSSYVFDEFVYHIKEKHNNSNKLSCCIYINGENKKVLSAPNWNLLLRKMKIHQINTYQCIFCFYGATLLNTMLIHLAMEHFEFEPLCLLRSSISTRHNGEKIENLKILKVCKEVDNSFIVTNKDLEYSLESVTNELITKTQEENHKELQTTFENSNRNVPIEYINVKKQSEQVKIDVNNINNTKDIMVNDFSKIEDNTEIENQEVLSDELFLCYNCNSYITNEECYNNHVSECLSLNVNENHCEMLSNNESQMSEQTINDNRFICDICELNLPFILNAKDHMEFEHNICDIVFLPVDPSSTNMYTDRFFVKQNVSSCSCDECLSIFDPPPRTESIFYDFDSTETIINPPVSPAYSEESQCNSIIFINECTQQNSGNMKRKLSVNSSNNETNKKFRNENYNIQETTTNQTLTLNTNTSLDNSSQVSNNEETVTNNNYTGNSKKTAKVNRLRYMHLQIPLHLRFRCPLPNCIYIGKTWNILTKHILDHKLQTKKHFCPHCPQEINKVFTLNEYKYHLNLHDENLYKCQLCSFVHCNMDKIKLHIKNSHGISSVEKILLYTKVLRADLHVTHHKTNAALKWICNLCHNIFTEYDILEHVFNTHNTSKWLKCYMCPFELNYKGKKRVLEKHYMTKHPSFPKIDYIQLFDYYHTHE